MNKEGKCQERENFREVVMVAVVTSIKKIKTKKMMTVCVPLCLRTPEDCHVHVPTDSWQEGKSVTGGD